MSSLGSKALEVLTGLGYHCHYSFRKTLIIQTAFFIVCQVLPDFQILDAAFYLSKEGYSHLDFEMSSRIWEQNALTVMKVGLDLLTIVKDYFPSDAIFSISIFIQCYR